MKKAHSKSRNIDGQEPFVELTAVSTYLVAGNKALDALKFTCDNGMDSVFSSTFIALQVLLSLFMWQDNTVSQSETNKKNYPFSKVKQGRLNGLATIYIEHELAQKIEKEDAVKPFAMMKALCVHF